MTDQVKWTPPFCANEVVELDCPKCGEGSVMVREGPTYYDGAEVEAYCSDCHAELVVYANVDISFSDPEVAGADTELLDDDGVWVDTGVPAPTGTKSAL